jgi:hypothetical protein
MDWNLVNRAMQILKDKGQKAVNSDMASHAEQKAAAFMNMYGIDDASLVINYPTGPCPNPEVGCQAVLNKILKPGQTLTVYWPGGPAKGRPFKGISQP